MDSCDVYRYPIVIGPCRYAKNELRHLKSLMLDRNNDGTKSSIPTGELDTPFMILMVQYITLLILDSAEGRLLEVPT